MAPGLPNNNADRRIDKFAYRLFVAIGAITLFAGGMLTFIASQLSACGGDGGAHHADPGSPQRAYCDANLDLIALAAPVPLLVVAIAAPRRRRRLWIATALVCGALIAASPLLAAAILSDA